jgi:purine nucleosidase
VTRLVIDTDPGVDDAHALMLAFAQPDAHIEAITTVAGNVGLDRTTANACTILDVLEIPPQQTPIFAGCDRALLGRQADAARVHGDDGLGQSHYPTSARKVESEHAVQALIRLANQSSGELTLVAIGPLTNVALATCLDPGLPQKYQRLIVMGGAIRGTGNMIPSPTSEFNIYSDPEAAAIVFEHWPGLWLLSWETTLEHQISSEHVEALLKAGTAKSEFFGQITRHTLEFIRGRGRTSLFAPDPLAVAAAIEPDIVTKSELRAVTVELHGANTRGQTIVDWFNLTGREPNVNIILGLDDKQFWNMMRASVL